MKTNIHARLQRLEALVRRQESERLEDWLHSCTDEELARCILDETPANFSLSALSNEQLIRIYHGEPLSAVLRQEREPA